MQVHIYVLIYQDSVFKRNINRICKVVARFKWPDSGEPPDTGQRLSASLDWKLSLIHLERQSFICLERYDEPFDLGHFSFVEKK